MSESIAVQLGPKLFQFDDFDHWVNSASRKFRMFGVRSGDVICLDCQGRVCNTGKEFTRAANDKAFPVSAYSIDPNREV